MASEIGVQKIQHTNGTDAMTIDSSGRILTPNKVAFKAGIASNFSVTSASRTKIPFVLDGLGGRHFNHGSGFDATNNRFVAPIAGTYWFAAQAYIANHSNTVYHILRFTGNDNSFVFGEGNALGAPTLAAYGYKTITMIADLAVGDRVDVRTQSGSDTSYSLESGTTAFSGYLIG